MYAVFATLKAHPGQAETVLQLLRDLAAPTRAEPGCQLYVFGPGPDADTVVMMERYIDKDALKSHFASAHFKALGPQLMACLDGEPRSVRFAEVD